MTPTRDLSAALTKTDTIRQAIEEHRPLDIVLIAGNEEHVMPTCLTNEDHSPILIGLNMTEAGLRFIPLDNIRSVTPHRFRPEVEAEFAGYRKRIAELEAAIAEYERGITP